MAEATLAFNILTKYKDTGTNAAARDMDRLGKSGSKLTGTLKKVGAAGAVALAAGTVLAARSLVGMTKAAIEDEAAQQRLAVALKKNTGATDEKVAAVERWITAEGKALGITDDEMRPALARLSTATHDVAKAQDLMRLAMDVSAGSGKSLETVTTALMKAQNGQVSSLSRLGINVKNAKGETVSFDEATKRMADTFGGQAQKNANTLEGKMRRLQVVWDEAKETVGSKLIPVLTQLSDWMLTKGVPALKQFGDWFTVNILPALKDLGDFIKTQVVPVLIDLGKWLGKNAEVVVPLVAGLAAGIAVFKVVVALTKAWAVVQGVLNVVLSANPIGLVVLAIAGLVAGIVIAYKKSETFRDIVQGAWKVIGTAAKLYWNYYLKPVLGFLVGAFKAAWGAAKSAKEIIGKAWDGIKSGVKSATLWIVDKVLWMAEKVLDGAVSAFGWAPGIGDKLKDARDKVAEFRADVNKELDGIKDEKVNITVAAGHALAGLESLFADGGPVRGGVPGKDSVPARLMPGEHVLTTDEVNKAGGHGAIFAIRRMLKRGEFKKRGDVPAFSEGGPVYGLSSPGTGFMDAFQPAVTHVARRIASLLRDKVQDMLNRLGGEGSLTPAQIARGQAFARSQAGDPYVWGGVGPNGFDCSGFVGAVLNAAQGRNPYSRRGTTSSMPWGGFSPGKGSFSAGWFTGSPGHMAGSIGGMGIESAGGVGVRLGAAATPVSSFPHVAHFDRGGWLQPGWTAAYNGTGRPERVSTAGSEELHVHLYIDGREVRTSLLEIKRKTRRPLGLA